VEVGVSAYQKLSKYLDNVGGAMYALKGQLGHAQ